jgi:hypothetical protein
MSPASELAVRSVGDFMDRLNRELGLSLPVSLPPSTALGALWAQPVAVVADPEPGVLYRATTTLPLHDQVDGVFSIDVYR